MSVGGCSEEGCKRDISVSIMPSGNPWALNDPESWAFLHARCLKCGRCICDKCVRQKKTQVSVLRCSKCGGALEVPEREKNIRITRYLVDQAWAGKQHEKVVDILERLVFFGVELTPSEAKKLEYCRKKLENN